MPVKSGLAIELGLAGGAAPPPAAGGTELPADEDPPARVALEPAHPCCLHPCCLRAACGMAGGGAASSMAVRPPRVVASSSSYSRLVRSSKASPTSIGRVAEVRSTPDELPRLSPPMPACGVFGSSSSVSSLALSSSSISSSEMKISSSEMKSAELRWRRIMPISDRLDSRLIT